MVFIVEYPYMQIIYIDFFSSHITLLSYAFRIISCMNQWKIFYEDYKQVKLYDDQNLRKTCGLSQL